MCSNKREKYWTHRKGSGQRHGNSSVIRRHPANEWAFKCKWISAGSVQTDGL